MEFFKGNTVGIDLGTTFSSLAQVDENGEPRPIPNEDDEVDLDFRRVPELWAWPIAGKATEGDEKKRDSKPLAPVISVYISQASEKYTATGDTSTGHSGVGIEFSRYSALAGRWQRYNLRFGYYMGGGTPLTTKFALTSYNNARSLITRLDRDELLQELLKTYLDK